MFTDMRIGKAMFCVAFLLSISNVIFGQNIIKFDKEMYNFGTFEKGISGESIFEYRNLSKRQSFEIVEILASTTAVNVREDYNKLINPTEVHRIHVLATGGEKSGKFDVFVTIYYMNKKKKDRKEKMGKDIEAIKKLAKTVVLKVSGNVIAY